MSRHTFVLFFAVILVLIKVNKFYFVLIVLACSLKNTLAVFVNRITDNNDENKTF